MLKKEFQPSTIRAVIEESPLPSSNDRGREKPTLPAALRSSFSKVLAEAQRIDQSLSVIII